MSAIPPGAICRYCRHFFHQHNYEKCTADGCWCSKSVIESWGQVVVDMPHHMSSEATERWAENDPDDYEANIDLLAARCGAAGFHEDCGDR